MSPDQSEVATLRVTATATTGTTTATRKVTVGTQFHGVWSSYDNTERAAVLDKLKRMGAKWVRIDMSWATLQPTSRTSYDMARGVPFMDRIIKMANDRGLRVLGMLWLTPAWAQPTNGPALVAGQPR